MKNTFRYIIILIIIFQALSCATQRSKRVLIRFPTFSENSYNGSIKNLWFTSYLQEHFSEFISLYESHAWSYREKVFSLCIKGDSSFIVTQTNYILDTPSVYATKVYISKKEAKGIIDSLKKSSFFSLKDESELKGCTTYIKKVYDGKELTYFTTTKEIYDGTETLMILYSGGKFRYMSYYELGSAKSFCPEQEGWSNAIKSCDIIRNTFFKRRRERVDSRRPVKW